MATNRQLHLLGIVYYLWPTICGAHVLLRLAGEIWKRGQADGCTKPAKLIREKRHAGPVCPWKLSWATLNQASGPGIGSDQDTQYCLYRDGLTPE